MTKKMLNKKLSSLASEEIPSVYKHSSSLFLSVLYGMCVVVLAIVLKATENISSSLNTYLVEINISKKYTCGLFAAAFLWLLSFKICATGCCQSDSNSDPQWSRISNKWLRGAVVVFGFVGILQQSLEVIAAATVDDPRCTEKILHLIVPSLHAVFILGQVLFLFFYAKINIQGFTHVTRFGIIHVLSTNVVVWLYSAADDIKSIEKQHAFNETATIFLVEEENSTVILDEWSSNQSCNCNSTMCEFIARTETFLSPLVVIFYLIASFLLCVTWLNVGRLGKQNFHCSRPSYTFYGSYKGLMTGLIILLGAVIIMTLMASLDSGFDPSLKMYSTEYKYLAMYHGFVALCNAFILLACLATSYVCYLAKLRKLTSFFINLDVILLFICLLGPLAMDFFFIISLVAGPIESKKAGWSISLAYAASDVVACFSQILLIVRGFGLERKKKVKVAGPAFPDPPHGRPESADNVDLKFFDFNHSINDAFPEIMSSSEKELPIEVSGRHESSEIEEISSPETGSFRRNFEAMLVTSMSAHKNADYEAQRTHRPAMPYPQRSQAETGLVPMCRQGPSSSLSQNSGDLPRSESDYSKSYPPPSNKRGVILRDLIMFLVIANICLWLLTTLEGTAFKVFPYQELYFGDRVWTIVTSITAPLSIFFKLHTAACLFKIWSFV